MHRLDLLDIERTAKRRFRQAVLMVAGLVVFMVGSAWVVTTAADSLPWAMLKIGAFFFGSLANVVAGYVISRRRRRARLVLLGVISDPPRVAVVAHPPGTRTLAFFGAWSRRKTMERIVRPLVADMQAEYFENLAQGRRVHAEWIRALYMWDLARGLVVYRIVEAVSKLVSGVVARIIGR